MSAEAPAVAVVVGPLDDVRAARAVIRVSDVDRREAALRASPAAARLPGRTTAEGRQLRRWIAHCLAAQAIVDTEPDPEPASGAGPARDRAVSPLPAEVAGALGAGSIALAVLVGSAGARAFAARLTSAVRVPDTALDRLAAARAVPVGRRVRHVVDTTAVNGGRPVVVTAAELPAGLGSELASAAAGAILRGVDAHGRAHELTVLDEPPGPPSRTPRDDTAALTSARARAFGRWLDGRRAELVHPRPGFEHPADPGQPDHTHHH